MVHRGRESRLCIPSVSRLTLSALPASAPARLRACIADAPPGIADPGAHMPRRPLALRVSLQPGRGTVPGTVPRAIPIPLRAAAGNAPTDSLAHSAPRTSVVCLHALLPRRWAFGLPALRRVGAHTSHDRTPRACRSIRPATGAGLRPVTMAVLRAAGQHG